MAADYLGGAKARYVLNGRAAPTSCIEGDPYIGISFVPPIPGAPVSLFSNTLYYRTVPMKDGRTHIAPWRAKGYLEIGDGDEVKVKVTSWRYEVVADLSPAKVELSDRGEVITIDTDYLLKD